MKKSTLNAEKLFKEHAGILRTSQAMKLGIERKTLANMCESGLLVKEGRGVYRLIGFSEHTHPDLVNVAIRAPYAIICLISALAFHELTTQIPAKVYIAIPNHRKKPRFDYPPLEIIRLTKKPYSAGVDKHILDNILVRIYCQEKTIADCFRFRNKIGEDVAVEALKTYLRQPTFNIEKLIHYARITRVEKLLRYYLTPLLSNE